MFLRKQLLLHYIVISLLISACTEKAPSSPPISPQVINPVGNHLSEKTRATLDRSPMDMIYLPEDYPVLKMSGKTKELPVARVIYSRPIKEGRSIFGNIVKYGSYWRLGANESTEIEFFRDVAILGKKVRKGRYIIYCIPEKDNWTIKLNNDLYTWGLKVHDKGDMYSFNIPVITLPRDLDVFTMQFVEQKKGEGELLMAWDNVKASLSIKY